MFLENRLRVQPMLDVCTDIDKFRQKQVCMECIFDTIHTIPLSCFKLNCGVT